MNAELATLAGDQCTDVDRRLQQRIVGGGRQHVVGFVDGQQHRLPLATSAPPVPENRERQHRSLRWGREAARVDHDEPAATDVVRSQPTPRPRGATVPSRRARGSRFVG